MAGPVLNVGVSPEFFIKTGQIKEAQKAIKAENKALRAEMRQAQREGRAITAEMEQRFARLAELQNRVDRRKAEIAERSVNVGRSVDAFSRRSSAFGGGFEVGSIGRRDIRRSVNDARDVFDIGRGVMTGNIGDIGRGVLGLGRESIAATGLAGAAAAGAVATMIAAYQGTTQLNKDASKYIQSRSKFTQELNEMERAAGMSLSTNRDVDAQVKDLYADEFSKLSDWQRLGAGLHETADGSVTGRLMEALAVRMGWKSKDAMLAELSEKKIEELKKGFSEAQPALAAAEKAAGMGDVTRAQEEQQRVIAIASNNPIVAKQLRDQGSPVEQFMRAERLRESEAMYAASKMKRGYLRTGD